jgi:hypothetical protein
MAVHAPAACLKRIIHGSVALDVALQLLRPVRCIALRCGPMMGTGVPEATVNEDRYSQAWKDDIGSHASAPARYGVVDAIAKTAPVQRATNGKLGFGVDAAVTAPDGRRGV